MSQASVKSLTTKRPFETNSKLSKRIRVQKKKVPEETELSTSDLTDTDPIGDDSFNCSSEDSDCRSSYSWDEIVKDSAKGTSSPLFSDSSSEASDVHLSETTTVQPLQTQVECTRFAFGTRKARRGPDGHVLRWDEGRRMAVARRDNNGVLIAWDETTEISRVSYASFMRTYEDTDEDEAMWFLAYELDDPTPAEHAANGGWRSGRSRPGWMYGIVYDDETELDVAYMDHAVSRFRFMTRNRLACRYCAHISTSEILLSSHIAYEHQGMSLWQLIR